MIQSSHQHVEREVLFPSVFLMVLLAAPLAVGLQGVLGLIQCVGTLSVIRLYSADRL